jgi:hypothetical protein
VSFRPGCNPSVRAARGAGDGVRPQRAERASA